MLAQRAVAVATGCCRRHEAFELRQDQVKDLRGAHFECALLEKEAQWISGLVARHLQYALVHRDHHDARRPIGRMFQFEDFPRLHQVRHLDRGIQFAAIQIDREWLHAISQRAGIDFFRARVADEGHRDITIAFKVFGQGYFLRGRGGRRGKPGVRIHPLALDGNQARTDIRCLY